MGSCGCVWVRWDPGGTGGHKNKASRHKNGGAGHDLGPVTGEISANIMFSIKTKKKCTVDSGWVRMGSHRLIGAHACKEKQKREENRHKWLRKSHVSDA